MRRIMGRKLVKKLAAYAVAMGVVVTGPGAIYAAAAVDTDAVSDAAAIAEQEELVEYIDTTSDEGYTYELGEVSENARATGSSFNWTLKGKTTMIASPFTASKTQKIRISATVKPTDKTVYIGIIEPDGNKRFVYATNIVSHTFSLTQTGTYRIYVRNAGSTEAKVTGSYAVVD